MLGSSIDVFHKNPAHQRGMLGPLRGTHRAQIVVGGRTFSLVANPVQGADGARLGTVVEWRGRTLEVAVEKEGEGIVRSAVAGDLSQRIALTDKVGFFESLSNGVNGLVEIFEKVITDTVNTMSAMAQGALPAPKMASSKPKATAPKRPAAGAEKSAQKESDGDWSEF